MDPVSDRPQRRYRPWVLGGVALAVVLVFFIGAAVAVSGRGSDGADEAPEASVAAPQATATSSVETDPAGSVPPTPAPPPSTEQPVASEAPDAAGEAGAALPTLTDVIVESPSFSTLEQLLDAAEMWELMTTSSTTDPVTVLAPTDEAFDRAFERLGADGYAELLEAGTLRAVLSSHVVDSNLMTSDFVSGPITTMGGGELTVATEPELTVTSGSVTANFGGPTDTNIRTSNGVIHTIDEVLIPEELDLSSIAPRPDVMATFEDGVVVISGAVSSQEEEQLLQDAARASVHPSNVRVEFVDDVTTSTEDGVVRLSSLVVLMAPNLASGTATLNADDVELVGVELDPARGSRLSSLASDLGVMVTLEFRPVADLFAVERLQDALDAMVAAEPIGFMPRGIELALSATPTIERIAARVRALDGVVVTVIGHTDSDGSAANNLALSEARAAAVRDALIVGGVEPTAVVLEARGEAEPVIDSGTGLEDKEASRRIEFVVALVDTDLIDT